MATRISIVWIYALLFLGTPATAGAHGKAYFIDSAGNDKNDGSRAHPWQTILRVNGIHLHAGDSILFRGSESFVGTLVIDSATGTVAHPIVVSSYGKGTATILSGDSSAVILYLTRHLIITHLQLTGAGRKTGNVKEGFSLINCDQVAADGLDITGFQKAGLMVYSSTNITIERVYAHENGAAGIAVEGPNDNKRQSRNIRIIHCRADDNPGDPTNLTNHSGNGIVVGHCTNLLIDYCSATNNGWDMPRIGNGPVGIWCYEADSVVIQHCLSYANKTSVGGADGGGFDLDGGVTNSLIQYCLSYGNQGSGYCIFQYWGARPRYHNIIRYNISENDGTVSDSRAGVYVWNSSDDAKQFYDCRVYNNTIYSGKEAAVSFSEKSERKDFAFYNNIFVGGDSLIRGMKGQDIFLGNSWWCLTGQGAGKDMGFNMDPHFKDPGHAALTTCQGLASFNHYDIPAASSLRTKGLNLLRRFGMNTGNKDFHGRATPPAGIGACF